jgi:hypothetical protein
MNPSTVGASFLIIRNIDSRLKGEDNTEKYRQ